MDPMCPGTDVNCTGTDVNCAELGLVADPRLTESTGPKANCHLHLNRVMQAFCAQDVGPLTLVIGISVHFYIKCKFTHGLSIVTVCAGTDVNYGPCLSWDRCELCWDRCELC